MADELDFWGRPITWRDTVAENERALEFYAREAAKKAKAEAARQLDRDEARALQLLHRSDPIPGYIAYAEIIEKRHGITVEFRTVMPAGAAAFANWQSRTVVVPPTEDEQTAALRFHEDFHIIVGECPGTEPHRRDLRVQQWWHCLSCESAAWAAALKAVPFTRAMFARLQESLAINRGMTPGSAAAVAALDNVASSDNYARLRQQRLEDGYRRELVAQWQQDVDNGR